MIALAEHLPEPFCMVCVRRRLGGLGREDRRRRHDIVFHVRKAIA